MMNTISKEQKTIPYWRNPTKEEVKFGHGSLHYREFQFDKCLNENGNLKLKVKASDDGLTYYNAEIEYHTTSKSKIQKLVV